MNNTTRTKLIRLAYAKPELREKILPLIKEAKSKPSYSDYADKKKRKGEKPLPKDQWETKVLGKKPPQGRYERADQLKLPPIEVKTGPNIAIPRRTRDAIRDVMNNPNDVEALKELVEEIKANLDEPRALHDHEEGDKERMKEWQEENQKLYGESLYRLQRQLDSLGAGKPKSEKPDDATGKDSEKKSKKQDGGEKSFADKKKDYEEKIKNSKGMSQKEKDAALKRLDKMSEEDLDKTLSSMGKGRKNKGKGDSDEESGGKQASLRSSLIRLAYAKPELREKILPLIKEAGDKATTEEGAKKLYDNYMDGLTPEGRKNTKKKPQDFYEKPTKDSDSGEDGATERDKEFYEKDMKDFAEKQKKELPSKIDDAYWAWSNAWLAHEEAGKSKKSELKTKMDKAKQKLDDLEEELKQAEVDLASLKNRKKASLRTQIIRLAHTKPELRKHLLPLLNK